MMPAAVAFPSWTPHPDVWLLVGLFAAGYAIGIVRLGPRWANLSSRPSTSLRACSTALGYSNAVEQFLSGSGGIEAILIRKCMVRKEIRRWLFAAI